MGIENGARPSSRSHLMGSRHRLKIAPMKIFSSPASHLLGFTGVKIRSELPVRAVLS